MDEMDQVFQSVARYFSILAEPARLRILHAICQQEKSVGLIVEETGMTQTNVSRHLNMMFQAGALKRRKDGSTVYYGVSDATLTDVCRSVCVRVSAELDGSKTLKRSFKELIEELR
ncbi:MAG: metalloregulator ArsR/SmtB family transcription factor [Caldimonas sp.]